MWWASALAWLLAAWAAALLAAWAALRRYSSQLHGTWAALGVPHPPPEPLFGNVRSVLTFREAAADGYRRLYQAFPDARYVGIYQARHPTLLVREPALARRLLGPDCGAFASRGVPWDARGDPLSAHLLTLDGPAWAALRRRLAPPFSPGRVAAAAPAVAHCAAALAAAAAPAQPGAEVAAEVEARELAARYATDVIGRVAFALDLGCLRDSPAAARFAAMARRVIRPSPAAVLRRFARLLLPEWFYKRLKVRSVPRDVTDFFCEVVRRSMDEREQSGVPQKDFLQTLLELRSEGRRAGGGSLGGIELTEAVVAAQAVAFLAAGLETTASAAGLCLLELAHAPDLQQRAFLELEAAGADDPPTYQQLQGLPLLDAIIAETLRKYPPSPNLVRVATRPYRLPHWSPQLEGEGEGVEVPAGTRLVVPVFAMQRDACHFPDPEAFRPDRFLDGSAARAHPAYMPFGDGPRVCIGQRLGVLQLKLAVAAVVRRFQLSPAPGRTVFPPRLEPRAQVVAPRGGAWLRLTPRRPQV